MYTHEFILSEQEKAQCKVSEKEGTKDAHKCFTGEQCKGHRSCTTFGWCRGKAICSAEQKKAACDMKEKLNAKGEAECKNDDDCRGQRICDDTQGTCEGTDSTCD